MNAAIAALHLFYVMGQCWPVMLPDQAHMVESHAREAGPQFVTSYRNGQKHSIINDPELCAGMVYAANQELDASK